MEEGSFSLVVQFTFYESLNAARLRKCVQSRNGEAEVRKAESVLGLIERPWQSRRRYQAALPPQIRQERRKLGYPAKSPSPAPRPLLILPRPGPGVLFPAASYL